MPTCNHWFINGDATAVPYWMVLLQYKVLTYTVTPTRTHRVAD